MLGYAYDKLNSADGTTIPSVNLSLTKKSVAEFLSCLKIQPHYTGDLLVLNPQMKLTSCWGTQALAYESNGKADSAKWALAEGNKCGAFPPSLVEYARNSLMECSVGSILFISGDAITFPMMYVQLTEGKRTDVAVVNLDLLNTVWYPEMLLKEGKILFGSTGAVLDSLNYIPWSDQPVSISYPGGALQWTLSPTYHDYLLRGDRLVLAVLQNNHFRRDVFFTMNTPENQKISLTPNLLPLGLVDQLVVKSMSQLPVQFYTNMNSLIIITAKDKTIQNNLDLIRILNLYRFKFLEGIQEMLSEEKTEEAKTWLARMKKDLPPKYIPFNPPVIGEFVTKYEEQLGSK